MEDWIKSLIKSATSSLSSAIHSVTSRLSSVWGVVTGFFGSVQKSWVRYRNAAYQWIVMQERHALAVYTTLRWIITTLVPYLVSRAVTALHTWASALVSDAKRIAASALAQLSTWAHDALNVLTSTLNAVKSWALGQIQSLISRAERLEKQVFGVLSTPERLAAWIVAAMFSALLAYAVNNAERLGAVVWANRGKMYLFASKWLDDVISRII